MSEHDARAFGPSALTKVAESACASPIESLNCRLGRQRSRQPSCHPVGAVRAQMNLLRNLGLRTHLQLPAESRHNDDSCGGWWPFGLLHGASTALPAAILALTLIVHFNRF